MKICIIGAGITGLSAGKLLSKSHEVTIYEQSKYIGGIARTRDLRGTAYHIVGGHCLNSKNKDVMDFIFNEVMSRDKWHLVKREAKIHFHDHIISYPIEFSIREIAKFDENLAFKITRDFLSANDGDVNTLDDWFREKFGLTLAEEYFIPYNRKIWNIEPSEMSYSWIDGKLPLPNKKEFFKALIAKGEDTMPHSTFYYPNSNNQNTFIDALASGLNILTDFNVYKLTKSGRKWLVNGENEFDIVISTIPLNLLPSLLDYVPEEIKEHVKKLKYNKVSNVLWSTKDVEPTWTYDPSPDTIFHRHIHIGNFFQPKQNVTITESVGEHTFEEMVEQGKKFDYLIEPLDYNVSDYAYVVYDQNYSVSKDIVKNYIDSIGIKSIGRFGEWAYFNMDVCIESAMKLAKNING